jgi:molybdopterin synthase sulfur carrier subunit
MQLPILLFAGAKQIANTDQIFIEVPQPVTAGEILQRIADSMPELRGLASHSRLAVNGRYVTSQTIVETTAELALIPPVSGG